MKVDLKTFLLLSITTDAVRCSELGQAQKHLTAMGSQCT